MALSLATKSTILNRLHAALGRTGTTEDYFADAPFVSASSILQQRGWSVRTEGRTIHAERVLIVQEPERGRRSAYTYPWRQQRQFSLDGGYATDEGAVLERYKDAREALVYLFVRLAERG